MRKKNRAKEANEAKYKIIIIVSHTFACSLFYLQTSWSTFTLGFANLKPHKLFAFLIKVLCFTESPRPVPAKKDNRWWYITG